MLDVAFTGAHTTLDRHEIANKSAVYFHMVPPSARLPHCVHLLREFGFCSYENKQKDGVHRSYVQNAEMGRYGDDRVFVRAFYSHIDVRCLRGCVLPIAQWSLEALANGEYHQRSQCGAASQFLPIMSACFRIHGDALCYSPIILDIQVRFPGRANANRHLPGDAVDDAVLRPDGTISRLFHRLDTEDVPGSIELYGRVRHPIDAALLHAAHDGQRLQRTGMHRAIQQSTALGIHVIHRHPQHGRLYVVSSTQSSVLLPAPRRLCLQHILPAHQLPHCADEQLRQPDQRAQVRHHVDAASLGRHADGESRRTTVEALLHSTSTNVLRVLRSPCVCNRSLHLLRHARISSDDQAAASTGSGVVTHAISPLIH